MKIKGQEITKLLDENLKLYKEGKTAKNIYFLCRHDIVLDEIVDKWLKDNKVEYIMNPYPSVLWEENDRGFLEKSKPEIYVLDSGITERMKNPFLIYLKLLNYGRDTGGDNLLVDLVSKPEMRNAKFDTFDLSNRMFVIATGFREDSANSTYPLKEELVNKFEIYEVEFDLQFLLKIELEKRKDRLERIKGIEDKDTTEWIKKEEEAIFCVEKLINTNFNIEDCGVYLINNIEGALMHNRSNTFADFIKGLLESLKTDLKFHENGTFRSTEKILNDERILITWLSYMQ
ncbi:MAG: hypothetical protein E7178_04710 [Erysipelotrichaceae bacterium]|nr:hypothetical protein [Erysipelotrichaceae bacterium]